MFLNTDENQNSKRKRSSKNPNNYFDVKEEQAVVDYISAETKQEKERIYNNYLKEPLDKMINSIIRRYKLYRKDMAYDDIHCDTHSFLMTKVDKFKPDKNKKAYSYFGTICKNYLMGQIQKDQKDMNRKISYEDISATLENRPDMVYYLEFETTGAEKIIEIYLNELREHINNNSMNECEKKVGNALIELFDNYSNIFIGNDNNKFNKNIILFELREMTNLTTKEIRNYLKKYKLLYFETLKKINK
jgi:hypothetical protein